MLRRAQRLTCFVLVWFALSLGVAVASTLVQPKAMSLVCTSAGDVKLVSQDGSDASKVSHTLDCPLCAALGAPPPSMRDVVAPISPLAHALLPFSLAHIATLTAPPLPSRGPPAVFL